METKILRSGMLGVSDSSERTGVLDVAPDLVPRFAEAADFLAGRLGEIKEETNSQFPQMGERTLKLILLPGGQKFFDVLWKLVSRVIKIAITAGGNVRADVAIFHNLSYERLADIFSDESFGMKLRGVDGLSDEFIGIIEKVLSESPVRRDTKGGIAYADTISSLPAVGMVSVGPETHDTTIDGVVADIDGTVAEVRSDYMPFIPGAIKRKAGV